MKQFMNTVNFILGGFTNICFVLAVLFLLYTMTVKGFEYGKELVENEMSLRPPEEIVVTIPEDASAQEIGQILETAGLINNKYVFWLQSRLNGTYKLFKSGEHTLDMSMSSSDIMDVLQQEKYAEQSYLTITISEGFTLKQIGALAESKEYFTEEEFVNACAEFSEAYPFLENIPGDRPNKLEGYLFPDTYYLPENPTPNDLIVRMLNRFDEVTKGFSSLAEDLDLTLDEILIMASVIEKEIRRPEERVLASSVIYNRMEINMPLQMCSTVIYVLDKHKDRLLDEDLQIDSPYNTYVNNGLPIGPICNPGRASIEAALNPKTTNYLYFVLKSDETGEHFFTDNFDDFTAAKTLYNQKY